MREAGWTPSIVPDTGDHNVYLVLDDLGPNGRVWRILLKKSKIERPQKYRKC